MSKKRKLLGGWDREVERARELQRELPEPLPIASASIPEMVSELHLVGDADQARRMLEQLRAVPLSAIGLHAEVRYSRPSTTLRSGKTWTDITSMVPLAVSLVAWVEAPGKPGKGHLARYVLDVRAPGVAAVLGEVLRLHVPVIAHDIKPVVFALWALGLDPDLHQIYDTRIAAACIHLGEHHPRVHERASEGLAEELTRVESAVAAREELLSLAGQCRRHAIPYPYVKTGHDDHRRQLEALAESEPVTRPLAEYASIDAECALRLYLAQHPEVLRLGLHAHLHRTDFPYALANARTEWRGVYVSKVALTKVRDGCLHAMRRFAAELGELGITDPDRPEQFLALMDAVGVGAKVSSTSEDAVRTIRDDDLKLYDAEHPAVAPFRRYRRMKQVACQHWLSGGLTGADGRIHARHVQLGTATGRNSCETPNLVAIDRRFRPVVVAPTGRALVELDFAQIEVGVVAAEYGDQKLINAYNSGDVYAYMAQLFYRDRLAERDRHLSVTRFKEAHPDLRANMKVFVVATLYGMLADAIALRFGISAAQAETERRRFLELFPVVARALDESIAFARARGYASILGGLRRRLPAAGAAEAWVTNLLRNTPVQGAAAVVFKRAVIDLDRAFRGTDTWLVLPSHDAILIECAQKNLRTVVRQAEILMRLAVRTYYPMLSGKVKANTSDTSCWNADGRGDSIERFLEDPLFRI